MARKTDQIHIKLGVDLHKRLKKSALDADASMQEFCLDAIRAKLGELKHPAPHAAQISEIPTWLQGLSDIDIGTLKTAADIIRDRPSAPLYRVFLNTVGIATKEYSANRMFQEAKQSRPEEPRASATRRVLR